MCCVAEVFADDRLALMARKLTSQLDGLAKQLGMRQSDVDRFRNDHPHSSSDAVASMLNHFK